MIEITCINKANGDHENPYIAISVLGWINVSTKQSGKSSRIEMYDWVFKGGQAFVSDHKGNKAFLITAISPKGTKYVKTTPDSIISDNLLKLAECK